MTSANLRLLAFSLAIAAASPVLSASFPLAPLPADRPWSGASERLIAKKSDPWITPAEAADFATTPGLCADPGLAGKAGRGVAAA
jgi:hypothetical protein